MTHWGSADDDRRAIESDLRPDDESQVMRESGIPPTHLRPSRDRLVDRTAECIEAALAESARTEANLNLLLRGLEQIVSGASASRESNSMLSRELDSLRDVLARSSAEEMALRQRVRLLEQAVERARRDAALERAFFLEQEDAFLAEILTDHEREVAELRRRLMDALTKSSQSGPAQKPSGTAARAAHESGSQLVHQGAPDTMLPRSGEVAVVRLGTLRIPRPAQSDPHDTPTPLPRSRTPAPSSKPPVVVQKPPIAARPVVGYSLRDGEVAEERVETPSTKNLRPS
jgi:hypothetical protein